jgi:hypothetical protein
LGYPKIKKLNLIPIVVLMPQKIKTLTMVNADKDIKEQIERSENMRHFIS